MVPIITENDSLRDLKLSSYDYELPQNLIAERPSQNRANCRLLIYDQETDKVIHERFSSLSHYLPKNSCIVINNTKVMNARIFLTTSSGGKAEILFLKPSSNAQKFYGLIKSNKKKKLNDFFVHEKGRFEIVERSNKEGFLIHLNSSMSALDFFEKFGSLPIPPYIRGGKTDEKDETDYQTVYAKKTGSVAAPTAGLHFTKEQMNKITEENHEFAEVTLNVGIGTFKPVTTENVKDHKMHSETFSVDRENLFKIQNSQRPLVAVGTTSLRVLESKKFYQKTKTGGIEGDTNIFLHPGKVVDSISGLITNFHLPKSSLLMLVSSLIGREKTLSLYKEAVDKQYRFFSYGDAMFIKLRKLK